MDKLNDPKVRAAIRLLKAKGINLKQIENAYSYYDYLKWKQDNKESFFDAINRV